MNLVVLIGTITDVLDTARAPSGRPLITFEVTVEERGQPARAIPVTVEGEDLPHRWQQVLVVGRIGRRFTPITGHGLSPVLDVSADHFAPTDTASSSWALVQAADRLPAPNGLVKANPLHEHCDWPSCACWCGDGAGSNAHPRGGHHQHWGPNTLTGAGDGYPA